MITTSQTAPVTAKSCHTATFGTRWIPQSAAVITVYGELDAATAPEFAAYAMRHVLHTRKLVLDLSKVEFFGTAGLAALQNFADECDANGVVWGLTSCTAVNRLLRICDAALPTYPTVAEALSQLEHRVGRSLQLVTQPR